MNEEQAVLDFFAKEENLPLGLSVAEQMDQIRVQMNTRFWRELLQRVEALMAGEPGNGDVLLWLVEPTGDGNAPDSLVGLHCKLRTEQPFYLRPMLEQQYLGGDWRIFFGLMWSAAPSPEQLTLPAVAALKQSLQHAGFKNNESFLAWQWTAFHPRRRDLLLRYAQQPEKLLGEVATILKPLLIEHRASIEQANAALQTAPRSMTISLDQLRSKRSD